MWRIVQVRGKKVSVFMKCVALLSVSMSVERRKVLLGRVSIEFLELPPSCGVVHYGIAGFSLVVESARAFGNDYEIRWYYGREC